MNASFLDKIRRDYPDLKFVTGRKFAFRPPKTVVVGPEEPDDSLLLLHELGHAILEHREFGTNVMRLKMERAAWEKARELANAYGVIFDDDKVERELDTYREWLDKKSRCPKCGLTRYETPDGEYHCPKCENL
ncbi:hypothetical protein IIZ72_01995 [Candidatus Saccharibacteria bacterium]|nr:hypothetical protein [Candidatus Saccharibacteria bacterium]